MKHLLTTIYTCILLSIVWSQNQLSIAPTGSAQPDSTAVPRSGSGWDSSSNATTSPSELSLFSIDAKGTFSVNQVHAGDTLSYIIEVSWSNPQVPVSVLAPESLQLVGLENMGVETKHHKQAGIKDGQPYISNQTLFIYHLQAKTPGRGAVQGGRLPYFSAANPEQKEYFALSSSLIDVTKARTPFYRSIWGILLYIILLGGLIFVGIKAYMQWSKARKEKQNAKPNPWKEELEQLGQRLSIAESAELLTTLESLACRILAERFQIQNLETLDKSLDSVQNRMPATELDKWKSLLQPFNVGRYGGGQLPSHLVRETYSQLKSLCLETKESI